MRIESLQEFCMFARLMNFSRAAEKLSMSQSCLSKHIADLERETGLSLVDRVTNGKDRPSLTPAGKLFFEETSNIMTRLDAMLRKCNELQKEHARKLRFQELLQNNAMNKLYPIIESFSQLQKSVNIALYLKRAEQESLQMLLDGEYDIVLDVQFAEPDQYLKDVYDKGFAALPLLSESPVIWFDKGNTRLAEAEALDVSLLSETPIIVSFGKTYDYNAHAFLGLCERQGLASHIRAKQLMDGGSPSSTFMSPFRDAFLLTSLAMLQDPRLSSRRDLECRVLEDGFPRLVTFMVARRDDVLACEFLEYARKMIV